jgi:hypothetical protein
MKDYRAHNKNFDMRWLVLGAVLLTLGSLAATHYSTLLGALLGGAGGACVGMGFRAHLTSATTAACAFSLLLPSSGALSRVVEVFVAVVSAALLFYLVLWLSGQGRRLESAATTRLKDVE